MRAFVLFINKLYCLQLYMLLSIQNNSLFKDLPNPKISMLAIALHFWKSFTCKRLSYCPMSICSRSAWAKVQHLFWSYSNSKPTASGCSLVGGESGEMGHSGPPPRLHPCRGDCSYCPGNLSTRGCVIIVSARLNIFFPTNDQDLLLKHPHKYASGPNTISWNDPDDTR